MNFAKTYVKYVGYIVNGEGVLPDNTKLRVIFNFRPPTNLS